MESASAASSGPQPCPNILYCAPVCTSEEVPAVALNPQREEFRISVFDPPLLALWGSQCLRSSLRTGILSQNLPCGRPACGHRCKFACRPQTVIWCVQYWSDRNILWEQLSPHLCDLTCCLFAFKTYYCYASPSNPFSDPSPGFMSDWFLPTAVLSPLHPAPHPGCRLGERLLGSSEHWALWFRNEIIPAKGHS